jgi:large subunit ribosomal protein L10
MRPEKTFLIEEAKSHLSKSEYFFLTDYKGIDSKETTELRSKLAERGAEFHVVKNSSIRLAADSNVVESLDAELKGHTAIIVGGDDATGVAKALGDYFQSKKKVTVKGGALGDRTLTADDIKQLAKLPGLEQLRSQLLSLLNTPASSLVTLLSAPARGMVTVLKAKADKE